MSAQLKRTALILGTFLHISPFLVPAHIQSSLFEQEAQTSKILKKKVAKVSYHHHKAANRAYIKRCPKQMHSIENACATVSGNNSRYFESPRPPAHVHVATPLSLDPPPRSKKYGPRPLALGRGVGQWAVVMCCIKQKNGISENLVTMMGTGHFHLGVNRPQRSSTLLALAC